MILSGLNSRTFLSWIFENKIVVSLGTVSYGLYVYHLGFLYITDYLESHFLPENHSFSMIADYRIWAFVLTVLVSYVSYYSFEKKFILLKDKHAPKLKKN